MELENIVANTVYIKAREGDRGRSRKWKELLRLPPVSQCLSVREEIEHTYEYLVENQPLGAKMFQQFCTKDSELTKCVDFISKLDEFHLMAAEKSAPKAREIYEEYISTESPNRITTLNEELASNVEQSLASPTKTVFDSCRHSVRQFLSGQPFISYVDSPFYWRYLQWKFLEHMPITKHSFRQYRVLGKGGFGLVYACQCKATGKMYALKKLEKKRVKKRKGEKLALNEKQILEKVNSKFVVNLAYSYQSKDSLCMVLTLMNGGDLRFHIHSIARGGLEVERVVFYTAELAQGLMDLHAARIAYRDMKPDNILLDDHGHIRISDLGLAIHIPQGQSVRGRVGTIGYMAPEVINNHRYTFSPDWWGLGCVVYEMINGECPFRKRKERVTREEVERRVRDDKEHYSHKFTEEGKLFCSQLLEKSHSDRLSKDHIKSHPFLQSINWSVLEAKMMDPPFKPNPRAVYAKDVLDIDQFSSVRGVDIDGSDHEFAAKFATGAITKPWQEEMIETRVFDDINKLTPMEGMSDDADHPGSPDLEVRASRGSWLQRLFKMKRQASTPH